MSARSVRLPHRSGYTIVNIFFCDFTFRTQVCEYVLRENFNIQVHNYSTNSHVFSFPPWLRIQLYFILVKNLTHTVQIFVLQVLTSSPQALAFCSIVTFIPEQHHLALQGEILIFMLDAGWGQTVNISVSSSSQQQLHFYTGVHVKHTNTYWLIHTHLNNLIYIYWSAAWMYNKDAGVGVL